jgi:hypothetical protein
MLSSQAWFVEEVPMDRHPVRDAGRLGILVAALSMVLAASAHAETGSANASDMSVHINLLGVAQLDIHPRVPVGFDNATDAADEQDSLPSFDAGGALLHMSTGTLMSDAAYAPGVSFSIAGASVELQDVDLSAVSVLSQPLISMTADAIRSQSLVSGYCLAAPRQRTADVDDIMFFSSFDAGNLSAGGDGGPSTGDDVSLNGVQLSVLGIPVPNIPEAPAPNTTIDLGQLGIAGATLILNERTVGGDGVNTASLTTNAMHLSMDVASLVTADVVFAHSDSKLDCTQ